MISARLGASLVTLCYCIVAGLSKRATPPTSSQSRAARRLRNSLPASCCFECNRRNRMFHRRKFTAATALAVVALASAPCFAQDKSIVVASTTSTQDSGLFEYLLPLFKNKTGITVKVVAQGT